MNINDNFSALKKDYLFAEIKERKNAFSALHPDKRIISLGIGDVILPLSESVILSMQKAVCEMGSVSGFRGYSPDGGYDFLKEKIADYYRRFGVNADPDDIFVSDGAKTDIGTLCDIFSGNTVYLPPVSYPVYRDTNIICGNRIKYIVSPDEVIGGLVYLCSPDNPTGKSLKKDALQRWVDVANKTGSVIIYDASYEHFIKSDAPHTVYSATGAENCAIEICSLSKRAGFTGVRCSWSVFPKALTVNGKNVRDIKKRRDACKFNGVSYISQRAAQAALSERGIEESEVFVSYYMNNARILGDTLSEIGMEFSGGADSPYLWMKCPDGMGSWEFFSLLLEKCAITVTPGEGFGMGGEGFIRISSFVKTEDAKEAASRMLNCFKKQT